MQERFWRGRWSLALATGLAAIALVSAFGAVQASGGEGRGGGHDPVTICHWVPAHGGSFVIITIDDDGLNGHGDHENDVIPASDECDKDDDTTAVSTRTHAPKTKTVIVTQTTAPSTTTPAATNTSTAVATQTSTAVATQTSVNGFGPGPDLTPDATNTSVAEATSTNTPEGDVGVDTATPETADIADVDDDGEGGVLGESVAPQAGGAEALPDAGTGSGSNSSSPYQVGLVATAFAAAAGAVTLLLRRKLYG